jgi:SAM-dependent methyltransferase
MSASELAEHAGYLGDAVKLAAYAQALAALVGGDDSVLDLGAGTGILGLLAARAGARVVYAVDSGPIIGPAAEVAARSPYADRIVHVRGRSTEIDLPEPVDVAVCDQIGGFVHDAGVLQLFADVRRRLLAPGGRLVPARFRLLVAPVTCATIREQIDLWGAAPAGIDFSPFRDAAVNTEHTVEGDDVHLLAAGTVVAEVDADHIEPIAGGGRVSIDEGGSCDGLVGWFEADMGGGAMLTNCPGDSRRMRRWCTFYPLSERVAVSDGDVVDAAVDVRPLLHAVTWRVTITDQTGEPWASERHSTLLGSFLADDELARTGGSSIVATRTGRALARSLALADGTRSTDEILEQLRVERLLDGRSPSMEERLRATLERFSTPMRRDDP